MVKKKSILSKKDGLTLSLSIIEPKGKPKAIVQISHGMAEHKERYYDFMEYLAKNGYVSVIHDHRGHGESVRNIEDLGYFYTDDIHYIVDDLYQVSEYMKERYKDLDIILFSHSMGTLVSRNYIQKYDDQIKKLILCGPPTYNPLSGVGIFLAKVFTLFGKERRANHFLDKLTFGTYNTGNDIPNEWICSSSDTVKDYNNDKLCGYTFTTNGFLNLYKMMKEAFHRNNYQVKNPNLNIFVIAGADDPVIQKEKKFEELVHFLKEVGYQEIESKLYNGKRHELLNEKGKEKIYQDILDFIEK